MAKKKTANKVKKRTKTKSPKAAKATKGRKSLAVAQLTARVTDTFKKKTKTYAKTNGLKMSTLFVNSLTEYMDGPRAEGVSNA